MSNDQDVNIKTYFNNPINAGEIDSPDATGESGSIKCRSLVKLSARIEKNIIKDIKFKAFGCSYTIASASYLTTLIKGKDILKATLITEDKIEKKLGKFPAEKKQALHIVVNALQKLITDYVSRPDIKNIHKISNNKVAIAMSGGVDSSMAAKLLLEEGWDIFGITMKLLPDEFNWENASKTCCSPMDIETARNISMHLNIPHIVVNLIKPFKEKVIEPFCLDYIKGRTPNPCIECNKLIKFGFLLEKAKILGANFLATGHYCQIEKTPERGIYEVKKAKDKNKDQSYVFWKLDQRQLSHIKTPLGKFSKQEIKERAKELYPLLPQKRESQEVCFISENSYHDFLLKRFKDIKEGKILNTKGEVIGTHKGYPFYTIGQRRGLGLSYKKPLYVKEIIPDENIIVVGEEKDLFQKKLIAGELNFISGFPPGSIFRANVKIRYKFKDSPAEIEIIDKNKALIIFDEPQRAITPGQSAVFYSNNTLLGGGVII